MDSEQLFFDLGIQHSLCGDAPEIENKTSSEDSGNMSKPNQVAALAMGKNAAMRELLSLPLEELERCCRHNGLSLCGGQEIMVARLLNLEEAEKQRSYDRDDNVRYGQIHSNSGKYANNVVHKETSSAGELVDSSGWNQYADEGTKSEGRTSNTSASLTHTIAIPPPELKVFTTSRKEKNDSVLPASKWAHEDDGSDDEDRRGGHGLGLGYSASGSEIAADGLSKTDEQEVATNAIIAPSVYSDGSMNEEYRQKSRLLEVAVMEYREFLEEHGIRNLEEIDRKVSIHRRRLQLEFGLTGAIEDVLGGNKHSSRW